MFIYTFILTEVFDKTNTLIGWGGLVPYELKKVLPSLAQFENYRTLLRGLVMYEVNSGLSWNIPISAVASNLTCRSVSPRSKR